MSAAHSQRRMQSGGKRLGLSANLVNACSDGGAIELWFLRTVQQLFEARSKVLEQLPKLAQALAVLLRSEAFVVLCPSYSVALLFPDKPEPYGDPRNWTWPTSKEDAGKAASFARKRVLGLVLPIVRSTIDSLGMLSLTGVGTQAPGLLNDRASARNDFVSSLKALTAKTPLADTVSTYERDLAVVADQFEKSADSWIKDINAVTSSIEDADRDLVSLSGIIGGAGNLQQLADQAHNLATGTEAQLISQALGAASKIGEVYGKLIDDASPWFAMIVAGLAAAFSKAEAARDKAAGALAGGQVPSIEEKLRAALYTNPQSPTVPDALTLQSAALQQYSKTLSAVPSDRDAQALALKLLRGWGQDQFEPATGIGPNPVLWILKNVQSSVDSLIQDVLRAQILSVIDLGAVKQEAEAKLKQLIPSRVTLAYDVDVPLDRGGGDGILDVFLPEKGTRLALKNRTVIDLLDGGAPKSSSSGSLGPFKLKLIGSKFEIVTLSFDGARFGSETGGKFQTKIVDVKLGQMVSFLEQVSSFLSFGSNGFYLRALFDPPGIEAGYLMPPVGFALGVLGISNISLLASVVLPFDGTPAMMKVGLSTPESPFLINVGVYGGGGHLALYASADGIVGFEASFEFGAVVSFQIGPLSGFGRVTSGVFLRSFRHEEGGRATTLSTIEGLLTAGGQAQISMFRFAAVLQTRLGQQADGSVVGTAIFTYSFSIGIRDISFRVVTRKQFKQGFSNSSPGVGSAFNERHTRPPVMLAANGSDQELAEFIPPPESTPIDGSVRSLAVCKGKDYGKYRAYFSDTRPWVPPVWEGDENG